MCLIPLECAVCILCKFGAFSEIPGIKISKFSQGSMPPDPSRNRSQLRRSRKGNSRLRRSLGQIDSNSASVEILSWLRAWLVLPLVLPYTINWRLSPLPSFFFIFYLNIFVEAFAKEQKCSSRELTL